jgi:hypothetical protein
MLLRLSFYMIPHQVKKRVLKVKSMSYQKPIYKKKRRSKEHTQNLKIQIMAMDINQEGHLIITRTVMMKK